MAISDEVTLLRSDVYRLAKAMRQVETMLRNPAPMGTNHYRPRPGVNLIPVVMQETMHHKKTTKTKAFLWLPDEKDAAEDKKGKNSDDSIELEIYPGPFAKGLWLPDDVLYVVDGIAEDGLCPIHHGRQFFEGTINAKLSKGGTATVTINSESIEIKEGNYATADIDSGKPVGVILAQDMDSTKKNDWSWRPLVSPC